MQRFHGVVQDVAGNIVPGTTVSVVDRATSLPANLFADNGVTGAANPFTNDSDGTYEFYVANGRYDILLTKAGVIFDPTSTEDYLLYDPADGNVPSSAGQVRLSYTTTTSITLHRFNGRFLTVGTATLEVPAAGVTLTNAGLLASTLYYIYAFNNAGVINLVASTTAFTPNTTTGVMVQAGDPGRTLVGAVFTSSTSNFVSGLANRQVISWFNRFNMMYERGLSANFVTTSATAVPIFSTVDEPTYLAWDWPVMSERNASAQVMYIVSAQARVAVGLTDSIAPSGNLVMFDDVLTAEINFLRNFTLVGFNAFNQAPAPTARLHAVNITAQTAAGTLTIQGIPGLGLGATFVWGFTSG